MMPEITPMTSEANKHAIFNTSSQVGLMQKKRGVASIKIYHTPKILSISSSADEISAQFLCKSWQEI